MSEIIQVLDIQPDYTSLIAEVIANSGFLAFRIDPRFRKEDAVSTPPADGVATLAHVFTPPRGSEMKDMESLMKERMIRGPVDIREVLSLGSQLTQQVCKYAIYTPNLTGSKNPNAVLKIMRFEEWTGPGLVVSTINPDDDDYPYNHQFIGFSVG